MSIFCTAEILYRCGEEDGPAWSWGAAYSLCEMKLSAVLDWSCLVSLSFWHFASSCCSVKHEALSLLSLLRGFAFCFSVACWVLLTSDECLLGFMMIILWDVPCATLMASLHMYVHVGAFLHFRNEHHSFVSLSVHANDGCFQVCTQLQHTQMQTQIQLETHIHKRTPVTCGEIWGWWDSNSFSQIYKHANLIHLPTTDCVTNIISVSFKNVRLIFDQWRIWNI